MTDTTTHHRICPLCEACCGLEIKVQTGQVISIRGHAADVFSAGYICPKGVALKDLHEDPDRLRTPLIKRNGVFEEASWDEAYAEIARRLPPLMAQHGRNATAVVVGNPSAHKIGLLTYFGKLARALGTKNVFSASTLDQMPKQLSSGLMFGHWLSVACPTSARPPAGAGRQPPGQQRQHVDRAGFSRQGQGPAGARRQVGGHRPAPHRDGGRGRCPPLHPPERRRVFAGCHGHTLFVEGLVTLGAVTDWVNGVAEVQQAVAPSHPRQWRTLRHQRRHHSHPHP
jgi:hypothetical protein